MACWEFKIRTASSHLISPVATLAVWKPERQIKLGPYRSLLLKIALKLGTKLTGTVQVLHSPRGSLAGGPTSGDLWTFSTVKSQKDFYHASLWMNSAWNLVQAGDETADGFQILDYLAYSISQEGNHEQARNITLLLHENYPENTRYIDNIKYYDELESVIHRPSSVSHNL